MNSAVEISPKKKSIFSNVHKLAGIPEVEVEKLTVEKFPLDLRMTDYQSSRKPFEMSKSLSPPCHPTPVHPAWLQSFVGHNSSAPFFSQSQARQLVDAMCLQTMTDLSTISHQRSAHRPFPQQNLLLPMAPNWPCCCANPVMKSPVDGRLQRSPPMATVAGHLATCANLCAKLSPKVESSKCPFDSPAKPVPSVQPLNHQCVEKSAVRQAPRFQCPDCSRSYSTFSGLSKHRQFHCASQLKRQFSCKFCEKHYNSLGALKMHIRTHTLPCKCQLCGKAFSRPWLLQGHLRTHTGEKPFSCGHCMRSFADRSNLRAHLQTHSEIKKYRCKTCQKTFSRMSLLNKHENNGCPGLLTI